MKQIILLGFLVWGLIHPASTHITITNSVFPAVGDTLDYAFGNQPGAINQIFTPPGGNQQWDLSGLQSTQTWKQIMSQPQMGQHAGSFPGASVLSNPVNSVAEVYWEVTDTEVKDMGYFGPDELGLGLNLLFLKQPCLVVSWAPANFFDIKQSASNILTAFSASSAPAFLLNLVPTADSFRIRISYQRLGVIDAFGSLTIPGGTFDVLRKKQTEFKSTAIDVKVPPLGWIDISTIGGQQILPLGTDTIVSFHFLNHDAKEAIAICTINNAQNEVTGVQYKDLTPTTSTSLPSFNAVMTTYPNPVQQILYVHFETETEGALQLQLINSQGQMVIEQTVEATEGINDVPIPVTGLALGLYEVMLVRNGVYIGRASVCKN